MAVRDGLLVVLLVAAACLLAPCRAIICSYCTCSRSSTTDAVLSVSCTHTSIRMYGISPSIPPSTENLDMSGHKIKKITPSDISHLTNLVNLSLADNRIDSIAPHSFSNQPNLRQLDLHGNRITSLNRNTFSGLTKLNRLDLSGNSLTHVSMETFNPLMELAFLNLTGNPIHCGCSNGWMVSTVLFSTPVTCHTPLSLRGRLITNLTMNELGCVVPTVVANRTAIEAFRGETVMLSCTVNGARASDLVWKHNEQDVSESLELLTNGSLMIGSMEAEYAGEYTCTATNMVGTGTAAINVTYLGVVRPRVITAPSHTHAFPEETVTLRCVGDHRTISYRWLFSGQPLSSSSNRITVVPGYGLTISNVAVEDSGIYTCILVGEEGMTEALAQLSVTGPLISCSGVIDADTVDHIRSQVMFAFNHSSLTTITSPHQLLRRLKLPDDSSIELLAAGDIFQQALQTVRDNHRGNGTMNGVPELSECEINLLAELSGCVAHSAEPDCSDVCFHSNYRSVDGSCNNLDHPAWGMADVPLQRLLQPAYEDGLGLPVGWSGDRPSARVISQTVIRAHQIISDTEVTHMLMQFGQFLDHDLDLSPGTPGDTAFSTGAMCDSQCTNSAPCFPIPVATDDPRIEGQCIPFTRSGGVCGSGPSSLLVGLSPFHREQMNAITSYIDGSMIYGSKAEHADRLRDPVRRAFLLEGISASTGKPFLPFDNYSLIECNTGVNSGRSPCFLAGDVRTNEQVGLTAMHTLFFREHNRVASVLSQLNSNWDQETVFQETRRIVIAEWQNMIYSEYVPTILGQSALQLLGEYTGYDPDVNPTIFNSFSTAAYRFGHSQILPSFRRLNDSYLPRPEGSLLLRNAFFAPHRILEEGGIDPLIRGLLATPGKMRSPHSGLNSELTEALFAQAHTISLDLAALNIQRGRDHGLASYVDFRKHCGLQISDPLADIKNATVRSMLLEVYGNDVNKIDLWVGGLLESVMPGGQLGPTFSCIIGRQFQRLRSGDRFWYEREGQFTPDQLVAIKRSSLSRIICDNADSITTVPRHAFALQPVDQFSKCSDLPSVNLNLWTVCSESSHSEERRSVLMSTSVEEEVRELRAALNDIKSTMSSCMVNGVRYENMEEWNMTPCTRCSCQNGAIECQKTSC